LKRGTIQALKFLAFLSVGILLLWLAFRKVDTTKFIADLREANYYWLLLSVLFGFFAFMSRSRRWILLIHPLGYNPSLRNSFYALMTGYLANLALPRMGEITRCVALGKKEKIPVDQLIGTVVVERTIDFISLMTIMVFLIFFSSDQVGLFLKDSIQIPIQKMFGATWIIWFTATLFLFVSFTLFLMVSYKNSLRKFRFFSKMFDVARGVVNGLKTITNMKKKWEFVFHTIFIWLNYALMTYVVFFSLESTSFLSFRDSIFILVIGGLGMSAPVSGGIGAFHYIVQQGLYHVKHIKLEDGFAYATLTHESQLIFVVITGAISFFILFRKQTEEKTEEKQEITAIP
jgi:glycosyltransferase 2 family protein